METELEFNSSIFIETLAQNSTTDLILALCHQATEQVVEMNEDFILDPMHVHSYGLPSRDDLISQINTWFNTSMPDTYDEILPSEYRQNEGEIGISFLFRALLSEYLKQNPKMLKIEFSPQ